jgi:excisionase family DNA binding protein
MQQVFQELNGRLLLRGKEVADALGISRALAYQWMASGVLPIVRLQGSRSIRVPREALLRWIEQNTQNDPSKGRAA